MDVDAKVILGKILGEIYRLQNNADISCGADGPRIYGLLNGFEQAIDDEIESIGFISKEKHSHVVDVLSSIDNDPTKMDAFKGYYDIEHEIEAGDVERYEAVRILTYLNANHQFQELISKMDTSGSPSECRKFRIQPWDE